MTMLGAPNGSADSSTAGETPQVPETAPGRVRLHCSGLTHPGKVRANNEDQFVVARLAKSMQIQQSSLDDAGTTHFGDEDGHLLIVADGMGGAAAGERASALAVGAVKAYDLNTLKWFLHFGKTDESALKAELRKSLDLADRSVHDEAGADYRLAGMGTTLTMAYSVGTDVYIVHVGDSRAYLFRDGELGQITNDHTLVQMLVDAGTITAEAAKHHHRRNIVTNVIGGPAPGVHAEISKVRLLDGDVLLLCTDGLTEPVTDAAIAEVLGRTPEPEAAAQQLIDLALANGGPDNVTAIVARWTIRDETVDA